MGNCRVGQRTDDIVSMLNESAAFAEMIVNCLFTSCQMHPNTETQKCMV